MRLAEWPRSRAVRDEGEYSLITGILAKVPACGLQRLCPITPALFFVVHKRDHIEREVLWVIRDDDSLIEEGPDALRGHRRRDHCLTPAQRLKELYLQSRANPEWRDHNASTPVWIVEIWQNAKI